jgi:hypothetical protein
MASVDARNNTLQGVGEVGINKPTSCPTQVLSWPRNDPGAHAGDVDTDMSTEVLTHIGGLSLFQELHADTSDAMARMLSEDVVCDDKIDQMLTHVGSLSLIVEIDMDTLHELQGEIHKPTRLEHGIDGVGHVSLVLPSEESMLQQLLLKEMQQQGKIISLPWDPIKQEAETKGPSGWQHHAEKDAIQCSLCLNSRSTMYVHAFQPVTDHALVKIPPWVRGGFSPGYTIQPRRYKCRVLCSFICSGCHIQYKKWDPGVCNSTNVTHFSATGTRDTGGCISRWRNRSDLELKDKLDNTTLFCHEIGVPVSAYGREILKMEQAHYANCSKSVHMVGHMMLGLTEYVDVLLDGREDVVWDHVLARILSWRRNSFRTGNDNYLNIMDVSNGELLMQIHGAWSYIHTDQRIKSAKVGHFITKQLACYWEYTCSSYCLQFNPCEISAVKAHLVLKALLVFCLSSTWPPDPYIDEVAEDSLKARVCTLCLFLCQLLHEALQAVYSNTLSNSKSLLSAIRQFFGLNRSIPVQLIHKWSKLFLDKNLCGTNLPTARLKCKLIRTLILGSLCYMDFSAWDVCVIWNFHIKGLMPDVLMQFLSSISVQTVDRTSNLQKHDFLIVGGVLMVALADKLRAVDLWTDKIVAAFFSIPG